MSTSLLASMVLAELLRKLSGTYDTDTDDDNSSAMVGKS
jgi:hypothetical protein